MAIRVTVVGGGPGGYVAAIRAAQLGGEVTLVEKKLLGGTCLNVGCIPTKALLHSAEIYRTVLNAQAAGVLANVSGFDWKIIQENKKKVARQLVAGVGGLLKANKIQVVNGEGSLGVDRKVHVWTEDGKDMVLESDRIILAVGSIPAIPPIPGLKETAACLDSTGLMELENVPATMTIIGGGVIGLEMATIFNTFGCKVTIVEAMTNLLSMMDGELTVNLRMMMEKSGVNILTGGKVTKITADGNGVKVFVDTEKDETLIRSDKVLVAVGRRPATERLGMDAAKIINERGRIIVNEKMETNISSIYAIGDCTSKVMLAHAASAQGEVAAENAMGGSAVYSGSTVASCVYTDPEFAGVGLTEEQAKEQGMEYDVGKFPLAANSRALIANGGMGIVKVLTGKKFGEIIGVHILGMNSTEIISEAALAIGAELTVDELIATIHPHPSVSEAVYEAVLASQKRAIHIPNR